MGRPGNEATLAFRLDAVTAWSLEAGGLGTRLPPLPACRVGLEMDGIMVDAMLPAESQGILTPLLLFIENLFLSNFNNNKRNHLKIIMTLCSYSGTSGF